ncbi:hypothetical protein BGZ65_001073 [Modicella reniformis]|uniref:Uncharacterized protein n=1 Tax=Modicella reniformis TaxID=1440133 RepID=A0A9P6J6K7_9FUNG|nr:hypothetical protein BGZ65_001073 [Modicella reniformis]
MPYRPILYELAERIKEHSSEWAIGEGMSVLADIDSDGKKQMVFLPESGLTDKFFGITEKALLTALLRANRKDRKDVLNEVFQSQEEVKNHAAHHPVTTSVTLAAYA